MSDRFTDHLRTLVEPIWHAQHEHPFVRGIGDGTLDVERFQHWVRQDYLFLIEYCRLFALAAARSPDLDTLTRFADLLQTTARTEMDLHRAYAQELGISSDDLFFFNFSATTVFYTDFLLRVAALGDYGELVAALLPCMWGYHELAARLAERGHPGNELYARWIDEYASAEFGELTAWCRTLTDEAAETSDRRRMTDAFLTSSRYELAFWDASWRKEPPLRESDTS